MLRERRQFLQFRLALFFELRAERLRQERREIHAFFRALAAGGRARLGCVHGDGKKSEALNLRQRRRAVGHFDNTFHQFTAAAARFI